LQKTVKKQSNTKNAALPGVQLLLTPFAERLDRRLFAALDLCNSVPAFLANVQLSLFDNQTIAPSH
jgi:hypothetical protein